MHILINLKNEVKVIWMSTKIKQLEKKALCLLPAFNFSNLTHDVLCFQGGMKCDVTRTKTYFSIVTLKFNNGCIIICTCTC